MKYFFLIISFTFFSLNTFANTNLKERKEIQPVLKEILSIYKIESYNFISELKLQEIENYSFHFVKNRNKEFYDCQITIKGNFEGTQVDVVVTIYEVSWAGCQTLKVAMKALLVTK
ncbi:hypothetical protein CO100_00350 [Candidatus Berkelbacteria bacterium CG_4_9_14_3_um_filter_33_5]|nr:MAG: hypothetical protein CO100_00350 [Candidatus Berkelbacteria bacterium CG_4_9_14_3_um_filter_33_5]